MSINCIQFKNHVLCNVLTLNCSSIIIIIIIAEPICAFCCYSFQRKVEMFHEGFVSASRENEDGYVAKTIALANCCPPFRYIYAHFFLIPGKSFAVFYVQIYLLENVYMCTVNRSCVERCVHSDPAVSEDSGRRANAALDKIVNLSVRVLNDRIFEHIRVSMSYTHTYTHAHFT